MSDRERPAELERPRNRVNIAIGAGVIALITLAIAVVPPLLLHINVALWAFGAFAVVTFVAWVMGRVAGARGRR